MCIPCSWVNVLQTRVLLFSTTSRWWVSKTQHPFLILVKREVSSHQIKRCLETKNVLYLLGKRRKFFRWNSLLVSGMCLCSTLQSAPVSEKKNSLFSCNTAICHARSALCKADHWASEPLFQQKNQPTTVLLAPVVTQVSDWQQMQKSACIREKNRSPLTSVGD